MTGKRTLVLLTMAAAIVAAVVAAFMPRPIAVDVVEVRRDVLTVTVEEEGKTRVIDRFAVSAPVAGFARRVELDVGDIVAKGDRLMSLEPLRSDVLDPRSRAEAEARVAAAQASLRAAEQKAKAARADSEFADSELRRKERLRDDRTISEEELDRAASQARAAAANLRSAEFAVDVAGHELEAARTALKYSAATGDPEATEMVAINAPVSGRVLAVVRESEGVVTAGQSLVEIGDPEALEVEVDVLSMDAVKIAVGTRVRFLRWGGQAPLEGVVRVVEPTGFTKISALGVEEQRVLVISDITSPRQEWQRLGDGYRVEASFVLWEGSDILQVPTSALFRHGGGWAVFVAGGGRAGIRSVTPGRRSGLAVQILDGLEAGEAVIIHPSDDVTDGVRLRVR
ncbi:MAG: HlyD family efflux transporter periplasmic adaptor subunit [Chromatiales bacterium]|jgi:HlyD family secretion protein|nr:HlyD family efflux transporter periplasmic adaptor subunit [Chromatiales bacterium]MDH4029508.1 HlyD family efflux transporter periplasmic adaptor subunit [Chromatiales bacterium]